MSIQLYSFLGQTEWGEERLFWGAQRGARSVRLHSRALGCYRRQKILLFEEFEIIPPHLFSLLDPLTNRHSKDKFQNLSKESCCHQGEGLINTLSFQEEIIRGIWCCHTDHALLENSSWYGSINFLNEFSICSNHVLKICAEHWKKLPNICKQFVWMCYWFISKI